MTWNSMDMNDPRFEEELASTILSICESLGTPSIIPTVVCVGTDRSTGDSLGPLVGMFLKEAGFPGLVLGTLENPIHAENLEIAATRSETLESLVIGIDACLGTRQEVGKVFVRPGPLRPGLGVKKHLAPIGDLYIAGVVNVGSFMEHMVLQNTRLSFVHSMARKIADGLILFGEKFKSRNQD
jgi:putative sporulation protein YyaC